MWGLVTMNLSPNYLKSIKLLDILLMWCDGNVWRHMFWILVHEISARVMLFRCNENMIIKSTSEGTISSSEVPRQKALIKNIS